MTDLTEEAMQFVYAAQLQRTGEDEIVVSFRDLPECLTSGVDEADALAQAQDALEEAIAGRIDDDGPIPAPSARRADERCVVVPADMAAKAALVLAFRASGLGLAAFAGQLSQDQEKVRRMLDPRHATSASRINRALRVLGRELVVGFQESLLAGGVRR
jgi:antitoxin HicB